MAEAKHHLEVSGDFVIIFADGDGQGVHHSELIELMKLSRSLAEVRKRFVGSRTNLIETLEHFGYDFDALLQSQFREGYRDTTLAKLHRVDPKWIARKREALGFPNTPGRSRVEFSSEQVRIAYDAAGSFAGAARLMGINRQTFRKLYAHATEKMGLGQDDTLDRNLENDRLAKARAAARCVGSKVYSSGDELKKFFDDEWGEG
ncbi:hypothetical protein [Epibacterium sp. Ofav1-8]|uniref:hypothetical protein n=1 Tax=Epibacterium sp. Ofav1-8 TaxID=2917735 RepID=UPI001EF4FEA0|nr:hypothetical protein [Epibacterium sp. Ofav1-8]MCG7624004.1 hypothetical protein [Epibacterium sp. Ofav1-8]